MFSTVMGYGFYGLIADRSSATGQGRRIYIVALVLGDMALFEALLLAAFSLGDLQYASVSASISTSDSSGLYVWMVLLGFGLRASIWPASNWSLRLFAELPPRRLLLLVAVPIATGWLGMWRWLPLQTDAFPLTGRLLVLVGGLGLLYGLLHSMVYRRYAWLPGRLAMMSGSGLVLLIGVLLSGSGDSVVDVTPFYRVVAVLIVSLAGVGYIMTKRSSAEERAMPLSRRYINSGTVRLATRKKWHELSEAVSRRLQRIREAIKPPNGFPISLNRPFPPTTGWTSRLIGFVVLALILAWLAAGG